jgi:hypothetical protein
MPGGGVRCGPALHWRFASLETRMILEALISVCFFAGLVVILTVPWMSHEAPPEHH